MKTGRIILGGLSYEKPFSFYIRTGDIVLYDMENDKPKFWIVIDAKNNWKLGLVELKKCSLWSIPEIKYIPFKYVILFKSCKEKWKITSNEYSKWLLNNNGIVL